MAKMIKMFKKMITQVLLYVHGYGHTYNKDSVHFIVKNALREVIR